MDRFVCVRLVQAGTLDLQRVRFDPDLTWAVVLYNGDGTVYARYGTRSSRDGMRDVSLDGFKKTLKAVLAAHARWPADRAALAAKNLPPSPYRTGKDMPYIANRLQTRGGSCIHCHHLREAELMQARDGSIAVDDRLLWPFPHPRVIGIDMDAREVATVSEVLAGSPAHRAGFRKGDRIRTVAGQPVLSLADVQWALHHLPDTGTLQVNLERGPVAIALPAGWRRGVEFTWRPSSQQLRALVGFRSLALADAHRGQLSIPAKRMALRVKRILQQPGMPPVDSGLRRNDVIVKVDNREDLLTESQLLAYVVREKRPGTSLALRVRRGTEVLTLQHPVRR